MDCPAVDSRVSTVLVAARGFEDPLGSNNQMTRKFYLIWM
jgi:hypothetical protein